MPMRRRSAFTSLMLANVLAVDADRALDAAAGDDVGHAVDAVEERRLAGVRRADDAEDLVLADLERDVGEHLLAVRTKRTGPAISILFRWVPTSLTARFTTCAAI